MTVDILLYQQVIAGVLALLAAVTLLNVLFFRSVAVAAAPAAGPVVSVLLPARNEEAHIDRILGSLVRQEYPAFEVLILDDGSTDATGDRAAAWCERDPRLRLLRGKQLPPGWAGKAFACQQLADEAVGDILLFVDADTVHHPRSLAAAVTELNRSRADLLTLLPHQEMVSFWEKLLLPLLHFVALTFLPMPLVTVTKSPKIAMGNGQFMMFRREVYGELGGHASVRTALVEDVWLARRVKQLRRRLVIRDGAAIVSCRMYRSLKEIWHGFSKNLFPGFQYSVPAIIAVAVFLLATSVVPYLFFVSALGNGVTADPASPYLAAQILLLLSIRGMTAVRFAMPLWSALLHPLAILLFVGIAINSCRWVLFSGGVRWKGRSYDFRGQSVA